MASKGLNRTAIIIAVLPLAGAATSLQAQSVSDQLVYSLVDDAGSSVALYASQNGRLIFRRNQGRQVPTYWR